MNVQTITESKKQETFLQIAHEYDKDILLDKLFNLHKSICDEYNIKEEDGKLDMCILSTIMTLLIAIECDESIKEQTMKFIKELIQKDPNVCVFNFFDIIKESNIDINDFVSALNFITISFTKSITL